MLRNFPDTAMLRKRYGDYRNSTERVAQNEQALRDAEQLLANDPDNEDLGCEVEELQKHNDWLVQDHDVTMSNLLGILPLPTEVRDSEVVVAIMGERHRPVPELI